MNAEDYVLSGEKTEKVLKRMEREGYIIKVVDRDGGGEESVDYVVGPRGKAEVGEIGVANVVRKVYGKRDVEADELERRLVRSLGEVVIEKKKRRGGMEDGEGGGVGGDGGGGGGNDEGEDEDVGRRSSRRVSGTTTRTRRAREEVEEDDEEEENEDPDDEEDEDEEDDE
jgi:hypothetical protein